MKTCAAWDVFKHVIPISVRPVSVGYQNQSSKREKSLNVSIADVGDVVADQKLMKLLKMTSDYKFSFYCTALIKSYSSWTDWIQTIKNL